MEEKKAPENADKPRIASNPAISSTLLSPSLSDALWNVEGSRAETEDLRSFAQEGGMVEWVQGAYREYS